MPRRKASKSKSRAKKPAKKRTAKKSKSRSRSKKPKKKVVKKKAKKRVSKVAKGRLAKAQVFKGRKVKTVGGLHKKDITRNKHGRYVSKKASSRGKKNAWMAAVKRARRTLKVKGFCAVGGKSRAG
jgi:hypothetical protein